MTHAILSSSMAADVSAFFSANVPPNPQQLSAIGGLPPNLTRIPPGCSFNPRCVMAEEICRTERPELLDIGPARQSACHFSQEVLDA